MNVVMKREVLDSIRLLTEAMNRALKENNETAFDLCVPVLSRLVGELEVGY